MKSTVIGVLAFLFAAQAMAQSPSHSYINSNRSSNITHYYVGIGAEGEFGTYEARYDEKILAKGAKDENGEALKDPNYPENAVWKGYGIKNELGIEFIKFLQFSAAHTSLNLRRKEDASERLTGSRFEFGSKLTFYAPLGNLQMGGGASMLRLDYLNAGDTSDFYGSGYFYNFGYNYFLSQSISFMVNVRHNEENLLRNSGSSVVKQFRSKSTGAGLGFSIWL